MGSYKAFLLLLFMAVVPYTAAKRFSGAAIDIDPHDQGSQSTLHIIGDTHGDENYLVRCLLSTELFELSQGDHKLRWKTLDEAN